MLSLHHKNLVVNFLQGEASYDLYYCENLSGGQAVRSASDDLQVVPAVTSPYTMADVYALRLQYNLEEVVEEIFVGWLMEICDDIGAVILRREYFKLQIIICLLWLC